MPDYQNSNTPLAWYIKYWELLALIATIIISLQFKDQNQVPLIILSLSTASLLVHVIRQRKYNTGIFFLLTLKLYLNYSLLFRIYFPKIQLQKILTYKRLSQIVACIVHLALLLSALITLAYYRYFYSQITRNQIIIEISSAFVFILFYSIFFIQIYAFGLTFVFRVVLQLMFTAYVLLIPKYQGISLLWIALNLFAKLYLLKLITTQQKVYQFKSIILLALEFINFLLVMLFKYGLIETNLSQIAKNRFNLVLGDYIKKTYQSAKQV